MTDTTAPAPDLSGLTFKRQERDHTATPTCDDPDCPDCTYRHQLRTLLGTLAEAAQAAVLTDEAALRMWGDCDDPECTFEQRMHLHLLDAAAAIGRAFTHANGAAGMWRVLPKGWSEPERKALNRAAVALHALTQVAEAHNRRRRMGRRGNRTPHPCTTAGTAG